MASNHQRVRRKGMPSKSSIRNHWAPILFNDGHTPDEDSLWFYVPSSDADFCCFACGQHENRTTLHRAHIEPVSRGGENTVHNLHLLCAGCHAESEGYTGAGYDAWFRGKSFRDWSEVLINNLMALFPGLDTPDEVGKYMAHRYGTTSPSTDTARRFLMDYLDIEPL